MNNQMPTNYKEVAGFMLSHSGPKVALLALILCLIYMGGHGWHWVDVGIVSSMFFLRGFLEWTFHKYVWHSHPLPLVHWKIKGPIAIMHANHHKNPYASEGLIFGAPGVLAVCALITGGGFLVLQSFSLGVSFLTGFLLVLMVHEWHHVLAHSNIDPISPLFRRAVMCHRLHHHEDARAYMGVSSVLADKVMGTNGGGQ